jgi:hypothetical protein
VAMMEALVADESRFVRFARQGTATGCFRQITNRICRPTSGPGEIIGFARETAYFGPKTRGIHRKKGGTHTNPARYHCFLSRFLTIVIWPPLSYTARLALSSRRKETRSPVLTFLCAGPPHDKTQRIEHKRRALCTAKTGKRVRQLKYQRLRPRCRGAARADQGAAIKYPHRRRPQTASGGRQPPNQQQPQQP